MQQKITKDLTIEEIFKRFPNKGQKLASVMTRAGLHCVGCSAATWETLEGGMAGHGFSQEELEGLLQSLNQVLEEEEDPSTVTISSRAAAKFRAILAEEGKEGWGLRLGEKAAGCSGFEYFLDYSEKPQHGDLVFESEGIQIHLHHKSAGRLIGSSIDYVDGLQGSGFKISNPNVKSSCGCGTSHGY